MNIFQNLLVKKVNISYPAQFFLKDKVAACCCLPASLINNSEVKNNLKLPVWYSQQWFNTSHLTTASGRTQINT